ncbi:uncharacterized protein F4822DRAFT_424285 [Hypoxylon trugodes]|uniref:uncharacterized protein n=1 Tax=Hypoxylon trugodes TaxID=326681 RepID=UPI0021A05F3B|nr:uncharacterized protein F4822DRAFT_424285 [Hypoxylon trugodes]KAI1393823.1 hypothetical protein F4822DRAFT_424285 [Hypoxylon trugodes]
MLQLPPLIERSSPSGTFNGTPPDKLPAENGVHVWRAAVTTPFFTFIFVALRFYTRTYLLRAKKYTIDDYIVALTMLVCIAHAVLIAIATYNGMGLHIWQYDSELNSRYYLWVGISSEFYVLGLLGFKSALILMYLQLFGVYARFRWACYGTLFFCFGYLFCNMMTEFFGCHPIRKKWEPSMPGTCINSSATNTFYGACNMASDLVIAILPLTMIWKLQVATGRQKVGLSLVLSCGFVAWAVAVTRWGIATYDLVGTEDRPWWAGVGFTLSILEINTGLICACAATLGPLWKLAFAQVKDIVGWTNDSTKASTWPSFVHKPATRYSGETRRPSNPSEYWANGVLDGHRVPAGRAKRLSSTFNTTLTTNHEDEFTLLDLSTTHSHTIREDTPRRSMEDV